MSQATLQRVDAVGSTGSRNSRRLRLAGSIPAVVYGEGVAPLPIAVDAKAFRTRRLGRAGAQLADRPRRRRPEVPGHGPRDPAPPGARHGRAHRLPGRRPQQAGGRRGAPAHRRRRRRGAPRRLGGRPADVQPRDHAPAPTRSRPTSTSTSPRSSVGSVDPRRGPRAARGRRARRATPTAVGRDHATPDAPPKTAGAAEAGELVRRGASALARRAARAARAPSSSSAWPIPAPSTRDRATTSAATPFAWWPSAVASA